MAVAVAGGSYRGAAWGTVTLLQALRARGGGLSLPRLRVAVIAGDLGGIGFQRADQRGGFRVGRACTGDGRQHADRQQQAADGQAGQCVGQFLVHGIPP